MMMDRVLFLSGWRRNKAKTFTKKSFIIIITVVSPSSMKLLLLLLPWAASPLVHGFLLLVPPSLHEQCSTSSSSNFARVNNNKNRMMAGSDVGDHGRTTRTALRSSRTRGRGDDYMDRNQHNVDSYYHDRRGRHHDDHPDNDDEQILNEPEVFFRNELDSMQQMLNDQLLRSASPYYHDNDDAHHTASSTSIPAPEPPFFLTHTALRRRQVEIRLLERLEYSDAAVDELMNVWIYEKPSAGQKAIDTILSLETHCESLEYTINTLRRLCGDGLHHQDWAELHNRLALVLALAGRTKEAAACVETVLQLKPWHFEAQHLQVLLALQQHRQQQQQRQWSPNHQGHHPTISVPAIRAARASLPPLSQPQRRRRWVQTAVQQAEIRLAQDMARSQQQAAAVSPSLFNSPAMSGTTTLTMTKENNDDGSSSLLSSWQ
jgi:hypothetical protein